MTHIYVSEKAKTMRSMARQTLTNRWMEAFKVMLVVYSITTLPSIVVPMISSDAFTFSALNVYTTIVSGPVTLGTSVYFLKVFRQRDGGIEDILAAFGYMWKSFLLLLLVAVKVFLWALLLIVPGIIAAFRYSQAFFILADDPNKTLSQCIEESKAMMVGNKGRLFCMEMSFIGWGILAAVPPAIATMLLGPGPRQIQAWMANDWEDIFYSSVQLAYDPLQPAVYLFGIGTIFLSIYITATQACFYDLANGNLSVSRMAEPLATAENLIEEKEENHE